MIIDYSKGGILTNSEEKAELLKSSIQQLYTNEGRSFSYIGKLLNINRATISKKIKGWNLRAPETKKHVYPSTQKYINKNRTFIKSKLDNNYSISQIAKILQTSRHFIYRTVIANDPVLTKAYEDKKNRDAVRQRELLDQCLSRSSRNYNYEKFDDEVWVDILGYRGYQVSNYGRIRSYAQEYKRYYLMSLAPNKNNGRLYVSIVNVDGKRKNLQVARVVAFAFCDGYSETRNTVNHKDGNVQNNSANNLEWVSQSENNIHSYNQLSRSRQQKRRYKFNKIIYKNKYEFKTVAAFARFLNKSETQTRRYLENPELHDIKLL